MSAGPLVVTYPLTGRSRAIVAEELSGAAEAIYLVDLAPADRARALGRVGAPTSGFGPLARFTTRSRIYMRLRPMRSGRCPPTVTHGRIELRSGRAGAGDSTVSTSGGLVFLLYQKEGTPKR
jgi:hypothetical protein